MAYGESAIRVIPYLQSWQIIVILIALGLMVIMVVMLARILKGLQDLPRDIENSIVKARDKIRADDESATKKLASGAAPDGEEDEAEILRKWGQATLNDYRRQKALSASKPSE